MSNQSTAAAPLVGGIDAHAREVAHGERFEFGNNWAAFLSLLDEERIRSAECALTAMLETSRLDGLRFLDIGSGSGLSSLAARRLGARSIRSITIRNRSPAPGSCEGDISRVTGNGSSSPDPRWMGIISAALASSTSFTPGACCITPDTCGRR